MVQEKSMVTFYISKQLFGIDVKHIQEILRHQPITSVPLAPAYISGLINLRGQIIVAFDLCKLLGIPLDNESNRFMNIVAKTQFGLISLVVGQVGDVINVSSDTFEAVPTKYATHKLIAGIYKLRQELMVVLDMDRLLDKSDQ